MAQQHTTTTTVITQQPGSGQATQVIQVQQHELREWNTNICACFDDIPSCLLSFLCGPFYQCHLASRMGENCCVPYCVQGGVIAMRTKIRTENHIQGSICGDCCTLMCCGPCAVAQLKREMDYVHGVK
ncbi:cornifelin homolog A-like [Amphiura filiformis]|uniref:cornifelin homolog A-like n=1 Tax=Amphiura filiformis TaxID=82378 RepID=UPI003B21B38B